MEKLLNSSLNGVDLMQLSLTISLMITLVLLTQFMTISNSSIKHHKIFYLKAKLHDPNFMGKLSILLRLFFLFTPIFLLVFLEEIYNLSRVSVEILFFFKIIFSILILIILKKFIGYKSLGVFAPLVETFLILENDFIVGTFLFSFFFLMILLFRISLERFNFAFEFVFGIIFIESVLLLEILSILNVFTINNSNILSISFMLILMPWVIDKLSEDSIKSHEKSILIIFIYSIVSGLLIYMITEYTSIIGIVSISYILFVILGLLIFLGNKQVGSLVDFTRFRKLYRKHEKPLTLNARNRNYIAKYNPKQLFPKINKYDMKELFDSWNVPTPDLYMIVDSMLDIDSVVQRLQADELYKTGFVIKPSKSFGGKGILIVNGVTNEGKFLVRGATVHGSVLKNEIRKILTGNFLTTETEASNDIAIIEEKITACDSLEKISIGLPDIRIIVFRGIPVMAMARLPTFASHGRANLKQGAIGAAIHLLEGTITNAELKGKLMTKHLDTGNTILGYKFSKWKKILATACLAQKSSGLGYTGVDLVIDKGENILVLEVNKRPGLEIQNINKASLLKRLELIEKLNLTANDLTPIESVKIGLKLANDYWEPQKL